jgi:hypothetical protein
MTLTSKLNPDEFVQGWLLVTFGSIDEGLDFDSTLVAWTAITSTPTEWHVWEYKEEREKGEGDGVPGQPQQLGRDLLITNTPEACHSFTCGLGSQAVLRDASEPHIWFGAVYRYDAHGQHVGCPGIPVHFRPMFRSLGCVFGWCLSSCGTFWGIQEVLYQYALLLLGCVSSSRHALQDFQGSTLLLHASRLLGYFALLGDALRLRWTGHCSVC